MEVTLCISNTKQQIWTNYICLNITSNSTHAFSVFLSGLTFLFKKKGLNFKEYKVKALVKFISPVGLPNNLYREQ